MISRALARFADLVTIQFEAATGTRDFEGAPSYDPAVELEVFALRKDDYLADGEGSGVRITLDIWFAVGTITSKGRVTLDGQTYIVDRVMPQRRLRRGNPDHYKARCRDE